MKKGMGMFLTAMACTLLLGTAKVQAAGSYEAADIERIYITSDTGLGQLTKTYVAAEVEVVQKDGTVDISDAQAKVKLRGNSTAKAEKKPFKIKFDSKQSVFGMDKGKKWNLLANAFDKTLMRNKLALDLADKLGLSYISQSTFVDVYYNGELMGNYLLTEPVEAGSNRVDIDDSATTKDFMIELERERREEDVTYIESRNRVRFAVNVPETPTNEQKTAIEMYVRNVETALRTYKMSEYSKYINVDSFVNYYIASEIFKAVDFNYSSTRFYVKDGMMYAGPLWDVDLSSGNASKIFYSGYYKGGDSYRDLFCAEMKWFGYLLKSDEFVQKVNDRLAQMYPTIENMYQANTLGTSQIDLFTTTYADSFARNYADKTAGGAGWSLTKRYSTCDNATGLELDPQPGTYTESVQLLRDWLANRVTYLKAEWAGIKNNYVDSLIVEKKSYNSIYLSWYNNGVADGSEIYMKAENGAYKLVETINDSAEQDYTVKNLKPGVKYTFRIRSFMNTDSGKLYSAYASISQKLTLASPKVKVKKVSAKKRKLSWKKIKGADGYAVYCGTGKNKLKKVKTLKGNKKVTYTKSNLKAGKKYYFRVKAYVKVDGKTYYSK